MTFKNLWRSWLDLFEKDDRPDEPRFDPVHLAAVLVTTQVVVGALFWLLWTLFVYEGGLPAKIGPALAVAAGGRTLAEFGWYGTLDHQGIFEGWLANIVAFLAAMSLIALLYSADRRQRRKSAR